MQRANAAQRRLQSSRFIGLEPPQIVDPGRERPARDLLEPGDLLFVGRDDQLLAASMGNAAGGAVFIQFSAPLDAQAGLQGS